MSYKNSNKDVLMSQKSHENIYRQHWEEVLVCLLHMYNLGISSMQFFPLEMSEVISYISSFNTALTY